MVDAESTSLACSPGEEGGIVEINCPHTAAKEGLDPLSTAKIMKTFFCKAGARGEVELKWGHDYFYQVQRTMAIMGRSWCDFVVWLPKGISVERIPFDNKLWAETSPNS